MPSPKPSSSKSARKSSPSVGKTHHSQSVRHSILDPTHLPYAAASEGPGSYIPSKRSMFGGVRRLFGGDNANTNGAGKRTFAYDIANVGPQLFTISAEALAVFEVTHNQRVSVVLEPKPSSAQLATVIGLRAGMVWIALDDSATPTATSLPSAANAKELRSMYKLQVIDDDDDDGDGDLEPAELPSAVSSIILNFLQCAPDLELEILSDDKPTNAKAFMAPTHVAGKGTGWMAQTIYDSFTSNCTGPVEGGVGFISTLSPKDLPSHLLAKNPSW